MRESYKIEDKIDTSQIYEALYHRLPSILPEFGFIERGGCCVSTTGHKVDGSTGKKGKVYIYKNNQVIKYLEQERSYKVKYKRGINWQWEGLKSNYSFFVPNKKCDKINYDN